MVVPPVLIHFNRSIINHPAIGVPPMAMETPKHIMITRRLLAVGTTFWGKGGHFSSSKDRLM